QPAAKLPQPGFSSGYQPYFYSSGCPPYTLNHSIVLPSERRSKALTTTVTASALVALAFGPKVLSGRPLMTPFLTAVATASLAQLEIIPLSANWTSPAAGTSLATLTISTAIC